MPAFRSAGTHAFELKVARLMAPLRGVVGKSGTATGSPSNGAFGPTNVAIHRVATAAELGDVQVAVDLGPRVDTSALPVERRVRPCVARRSDGESVR